jgi:hypothetical protein
VATIFLSALTRLTIVLEQKDGSQIGGDGLFQSDGDYWLVQIDDRYRSHQIDYGVGLFQIEDKYRFLQIDYSDGFVQSDDKYRFLQID